MRNALTLSQHMNVMRAGAKEFAKYRVDAARWQRYIQTQYILNDKLLECDPRRVALCLLNAAALDLEPNGRHFAIVPFAGVPQLIIMYHGLVFLAYQSERVKQVEAHCVYEGDNFDWEYGSNQFIRHQPKFEPDAPMRFAWSRVTTDGGGEILRVVPYAEIEALKQKQLKRVSKKQESPWYKYPEPMAQKTAFKRLAVWIPQNPRMSSALAYDDAVEAELPQQAPLNAVHDEAAFDTVDVEQLSQEQSGSKSERMADDLTQQQEPVEDADEGQLFPNAEGVGN